MYSHSRLQENHRAWCRGLDLSYLSACVGQSLQNWSATIGYLSHDRDRSLFVRVHCVAYSGVPSSGDSNVDALSSIE